MEIRLRYNNLNTIIKDTIKGTKNDNLVDNIRIYPPNEYYNHSINLKFYHGTDLIINHQATNAYIGEVINYSVPNLITQFNEVYFIIEVNLDQNGIVFHWESNPIYIYFKSAIVKDLSEAPPL